MATVLDDPVAAVGSQQSRSVDGSWGMAGDALDDFGGGRSGLFVDGRALNHQDLADAGKVQVVVEAGGGPDGALFHAAMGRGERPGEVGRASALEDQADIFAQGWLIALDGEDVVGVVVSEVVGEFALGQQGVGGDGTKRRCRGALAAG